MSKYSVSITFNPHQETKFYSLSTKWKGFFTKLDNEHI